MNPVEILRACVEESNGDLAAAVLAADYIFSTDEKPSVQGIETKTQQPTNIAFSFDIHNRRAQGILNRSLQAIKGMTDKAKRDLSRALRTSETDGGQAILDFVDRYRTQLARILTATQLASLLEGAREVASTIPTLATFAGAVSPPPTLEPEKAIALVERLEKLTGMERAQAIYDLPSEQQVYVQQALAAKEAAPPIVPPPFKPPAPSPGAPEGVHFPIIEEAIEQLSEKNAITREQFDALDAAARAKAFTVAGVDSEETLRKIRDVLAENIRQGADYETFRQKILDAVDEGTFLSPAHMETVFRTNIQTAFSDGQAAVLSHPMVRSGFPYSAYDAIHDDRVRENHLALEKLGIDGSNVYRNDDPVFQMFRPPWDYNDRCSWTPITVRQAAELGVKEAQEWLETGAEPAQKAFVSMPDFRPPEGFQRSLNAMPLSIQLSLQPMMTFSTDASGHEHRGKGPGGGQFVEKGKGETSEPRTFQRNVARRGEMVSARRQGEGKEAKIVLESGEDAPAHILTGKIPPAWKDVRVSLDPDADVLATGFMEKTDSATGKVKKVPKVWYNDKFHERGADLKFGRVMEAVAKDQEIRQQILQRRQQQPEEADATWLMDVQATRPGSEADTKGISHLLGREITAQNIEGEIKTDKKGKKSSNVFLTFDYEGQQQRVKVKDVGTAEQLLARRNSGQLEDSDYWLNSYGATTLEGRHVVPTNEGVRLQFVGKEGVWHDHLIRDPELAKVLVARKERAGDKGKLFNTDETKVRSFVKRLDGGGFTSKDLRTKRANLLAIEEIQKHKDCCKSDKEYKAAVKEVAEKVSSVLGNDPLMALSKYINPAVFSGWKALCENC